MTSIKSLVLICDTHFFQRLHGVVNYVDLPECSSQETLCRGIEQHGIVERDHMRCEVVPHSGQVMFIGFGPQLILGCT